MSTHTLRLHTGVTLPFVAQGEAGPPLLFLHGYSDSHLSMAPLLAALPTDRRAVAVTQRGHGDADKPDHGYGLDVLAEDAAAALDALGAPQAIVVGHSMGAAVATLLAAAHPERVAGLVLMGAFADMRTPEVEGLAADVAQLTDPVDRAFVEAFQRSTLSAPVSEAFLAMVVAESLKLPARVWRALCEGFLACDLPAALRRVQAPTLVLWGDRDGFCARADQEAICAAIPGARLSVHAGANHALHWERPAAIAADIVAFVERTDRTATRPLPVAAASFRT